MKFQVTNLQHSHFRFLYCLSLFLYTYITKSLYMWFSFPLGPLLLFSPPCIFKKNLLFPPVIRHLSQYHQLLAIIIQMLNTDCIHDPFLINFISSKILNSLILFLLKINQSLLIENYFHSVQTILSVQLLFSPS